MDNMVNVCGDCILKSLPMCTDIDCIEVEEIQKKYTEKVRRNSVKEFAKFLVDNKEHNQETMQYWVDTFFKVNGIG